MPASRTTIRRTLAKSWVTPSAVIGFSLPATPPACSRVKFSLVVVRTESQASVGAHVDEQRAIWLDMGKHRRQRNIEPAEGELERHVEADFEEEEIERDCHAAAESDQAVAATTDIDEACEAKAGQPTQD